jgi:hypothetical protein
MKVNHCKIHTCTRTRTCIGGVLVHVEYLDELIRKLNSDVSDCYLASTIKTSAATRPTLLCRKT